MADTRTAVTPPLMPVSEAVQEQIHFDTLWATTQAALEVYAGQGWTARNDDDPGVTLLQAFAYGVSDVSYRHTLPLIDILTEKTLPTTSSTDSIHLQHSGGIFAPEFGPERALTSSPVTLDDYRRAILDLTIPAHGHDVFCFRDAQIARVPAKKSYRYSYTPDNYAFQFLPDSDSTGQPHWVLGQYWLSVTLTPGVDEFAARHALVEYLKNHRNLCEQEIVSPTFVPVILQTPAVQLFLDDDLPEGEAMNQAVAQALWAINLALLPAAIREPAAVRLARGETAEQVYAGPQLEHGWISHLPPPRPMDDAQLKSSAVNVQELSAAAIGAVPGINAVDWLKTKTISVSANQQAQLWVNNLGELTSPGFIQLYKRGQLIASTVWNVGVTSAYNQLNQTARRATKDPLRAVLYGRNRHPGFYRTVGASLPPVYGLQQAAGAVATDVDAKNLLQFLRPFEQLLANSADQLKKLPRLLAFDGRDPEAALWGAAQWPQKSDDPLAFEQTQSVMTKDVMSALTQEINHQSQDNEKELAILDHLLGYFGERRAPRALNASAHQSTDGVEFRHVQQGFLRQVTRLAYERASISISRVSALQRKVAARLGVGEMLFDERLQKPDAPFPTQYLPFYMIEHQELLPQNPGADGGHGGWQTDHTVTLPTILADNNLLTLTLAGDAVKKLKAGQLIELMADGSAKKLPTLEPLTALVIHHVDKSTSQVSIELGQQTRLGRTVPLLRNPDYKWYWRLSQIWLKRVVYDLVFVTRPAANAETATLKVTPSFPAELAKGQRFALRPKGRWLSWPTAADIKGPGLEALPDVVVEVVHADPLGGTVAVKWIAQSPPKITDKGTADPSQRNVVSVSPVTLTELTPTKPKWTLLTQSDKSYAWSMPYGNDSFAFTLSIVLNRAWLAGSQNPGALSQWIQNMVREEMPSHLKLHLHWLDEAGFNSFVRQYEKWQLDSRPVGDQSYELLRLLGIGDRPVDERSGIGFVRIVDTSYSEAIEKRIARNPGQAREDMLKRESVVYVRGSVAV